MNKLSKSTYAKYCKCPKCLWLSINKPEQEIIDPTSEARFETGTEVGELARGLFGDYELVTSLKSDGSLDLKAMVQKTQELMAAGVENICEAAFIYQGNYCAVDILHKTNDGYAIYEVKSSSFPEFNGKAAKLDKYLPDIAYQKWVLLQCGIQIAGTYLVCLNSDYVREGELDMNRLFVITDMSERIEAAFQQVEINQQSALSIANNDEEPVIDLSESCKKPYDCGFIQYCMSHIPKPSVFDLYRMNFSKKLEYYYNDKITFEDIKDEDLTPVRRIQVDSVLNDEPHINLENIKTFLKTITYPLYFLDFESMQFAIPPYDGMKPFQQICFQYSLHIIEYEGGPLLHKEHLGVSGTDPRKPLAQQLCEDIPMGVCTLVYNKSFECTRLKEMADFIPELSEHLLDIRDHIVDLLVPFQKGDYYLPSMGGSFSIKRVLPSLFPDDPTLDYHNLSGGVQNGNDAMTIFPKIQNMTPDEQARTCKALLEYCCLDTYAMVKVYDKLIEVVNKE